MAEERIQLTLGGQYTAGDAFNSMNADIKNTQKSAKDLTQSFSGGIRQVAGQLDGELGDALNTASNTITSLAKGGVWGLLATAASAAIGYIVSKWKEAEEAAKSFAKICQDEVVQRLNLAKDEFKNVSTEIQQTKNDVKEMADVINGETARSAQMQIHELHISTLQKITDDMSDASKRVLEENEKYDAQLIKNNAALEIAQQNIKTSAENVKLAADKRIAAEQQLEQVTTKRAELEGLMEDYGRGWLAKRQEIEANIQKNEEMYSDGLEDQYTYIQNNKQLKLELEKLETEQKDNLDKLNSAIKSQTDAKNTLAQAVKDEETATRKLEQSRKDEEAAIVAARAALEERNQHLIEANKLQEEENKAKRKKIEQEELERLSSQDRLDLLEATNKAERTSLSLNIDKNYLLETYKNLASEGLGKEERYQALTERINQILKGRAEIENYCAQYGIDSIEIINAFNQSMYEGNDVTKAYADAQQRLTDVINEREGVEGELLEDAKSYKRKKGSSASASASVSVDIDSGQVSDGVVQADQQTTMSSTFDEIRNEESTLKNEVIGMKNYLEGRMSDNFANAYVNKLVEKFNREQIEKIYDKVAKNTLGLTESERKKWQGNIAKVAKALERAGLH